MLRMPRNHTLETRVPPPLLAAAAAVVQRRLPRRPARAWRRAVAGGVALGSLALAGQAEHLFRSSGTTVMPFAPERASALVTTGSYAVTRNPMYVAMAGVLLAHAIHRGHPLQLLPLAGWAAFIDRFQIVPEERALTSVFGEEYDAYRRRVRRWL
jgi:protein-S-isoprenylcysteine O-methyltransferase Ste14